MIYYECRVKRIFHATHLHVHVLGAGGVHGEVGEVDVGLQRRGQLHLEDK